MTTQSKREISKTDAGWKVQFASQRGRPTHRRGTERAVTRRRYRFDRGALMLDLQRG